MSIPRFNPRKSKPTSVREDLHAALRLAEPHAVRLILEDGIRPDGNGVEWDATNTALSLADVLLPDDEDRLQEMLRAVQHAYVLGLAVGLKLRGIGGPDALGLRGGK
jgi:hypothetical protein